MQIGEVSSRVGLSLRTIRHYDELGLVVPSGRSAGGFRIYSEQDVERLLLIKTLRPLDLSLDRIRDLLVTIDEVARDPDAAEDAVARLAVFRALAESRIEALRLQVQGLERLTRELRSLERSGRPPASDRSHGGPATLP